MAKEGSTLSGIMDAFALSVSIALQYGVPLRALVDKFVNSRFEPSGYTGKPEIHYAKSIVDYIGRWLGGKFISPEYLDNGGAAPLAEAKAEAVSAAPAGTAAVAVPATSPRTPEAEVAPRPRSAIDDAPYCSECGMLMTPNGSCYKCSNCGSTSGCS
jgi:ribonucleoside-diphosphate reductase alpha chain